MELAYHIFVVVMLLVNFVLTSVLIGGCIYIYKIQPISKLDHLFQLCAMIRKDIKSISIQSRVVPEQEVFQPATSIEDLEKQQFSNLVMEFMEQGWTKAEATRRANEIMLEKVVKHMEGGMEHYD